MNGRRKPVILRIHGILENGSVFESGFRVHAKGGCNRASCGSNSLDFAFKIHSDIGCKCVGAKVNGKMVTIDHKLENGDIIEIVTNPNSAGPSIDWLRIAKSSSARNKIRQWLKKENKTNVVDKGKDIIDRYIRKKRI